jgi:hypothetical protein
MSFSKKVALYILGLMLRLSIGLAVFGFGFMAVFGSADPLKQAAEESGLYDSVVSGVIEESVRQQPQSEGLPLDDPRIISAANAAFTAEILQQQSEMVIDSVFAWLDGTKDSLQFTLDFSDTKVVFANNVGDAFLGYAETLPVCTQPDQLQPVSNPFELSCIPPQTDLRQERAKLVEEIITADSFLQEPVTEQQLAAENPQFIGLNSSLPQLWRLLQTAPLIMTATSLIFAIIYVHIYGNKKLAVARIGRLLVISSIFTIIWLFLFRYLVFDMHNFDNPLQVAIMQMAGILYEKFMLNVGVISAGISVVGAGLWVYIRHVEPRISSK